MGHIAEGITFTHKFTKGQVLFGKRRGYQRKAALAEFDGPCSGDMLVFEPKDGRLLPELLPFIVPTDRFVLRITFTRSPFFLKINPIPLIMLKILWSKSLNFFLIRENPSDLFDPYSMSLTQYATRKTRSTQYESRKINHDPQNPWP